MLHLCVLVHVSPDAAILADACKAVPCGSNAGKALCTAVTASGRSIMLWFDRQSHSWRPPQCDKAYFSGLVTTFKSLSVR